MYPLAAAFGTPIVVTHKTFRRRRCSATDAAPTASSHPHP